MVSNVSSAPRPVIGITSYVERTRYGVWDLDAAVLPRNYLDAVLTAGGVPVLLPSIGERHHELLRAVDGLILTGGADIEPSRYDRPAHPRTSGLRPERDAFEFGLLHAALAGDLPILGICRGMQLLNVALGGTLVQHLPERTGDLAHRPELGVFGPCQVGLTADSVLAGVLGERTTVPCHHHQAVDEVGSGLRVTGRAADGTVEAVEAAGPRFLVGVQWHPEENAEDNRLFAALVRAAAANQRREVTT